MIPEDQRPWPKRIWDWLGAPLTQADRHEEQREAIPERVDRARGRRARLRLLAALAVVVAVAAFLSAFYPTNRFVRGIAAAAIASAAPIALYLGLRRD
jgi:ferric-dicitrate binding protein FerR (iron transport regulator)